MAVNYQKVLDETLKNVSASVTAPRLLLHSCCGPCSSYVLDYLSQYFDITVLYYNPNIWPESEYS
jgi:predicted adenine nucleotide alpha hydrolase (AANH) superfamily ATPase